MKFVLFSLKVFRKWLFFLESWDFTMILSLCLFLWAFLALISCSFNSVKCSWIVSLITFCLITQLLDLLEWCFSFSFCFSSLWIFVLLSERFSLALPFVCTYPSFHFCYCIFSALEFSSVLWLCLLHGILFSSYGCNIFFSLFDNRMIHFLSFCLLPSYLFFLFAYFGFHLLW